jgi:hyperosmotically inducible periplasmic protein
MNIIHPERRNTTLLTVSIAAAALLLPLSASAYESRDSKDQAVGEQAREIADKAGDTASDIRMHLAIETKLALHDELSALMIDTDVKDGEVRLQGEVKSSTERELAEELAKSVEGVKSVRNDLEVKGDEPTLAERLMDGASDAALTTRVKSRLLASSNTPGLAISVTTDNSIVTLSGEVESDTERELAELIAANTSGVEGVRNDLRIGND